MSNGNGNGNPRPMTNEEFDALFLRPQISGPGAVDLAARDLGESRFRSELGKYDTGLSPALYQSGYEKNPMLAQQYLRASNQSGARQLWNGFWSRGLSIVPKVGQGLGHVLGGAGAVLTQDSELLYDNAIVSAFQQMDEGLKENIPVYQSKAYTEGNWVRKLGTTSFWATDAFDGLAFLASAYVPGGVASRLGSASKALQGSRFLAARKFGSALKQTGQAAGINTQLAASTLYNTISEAGFEANEVNKTIREQYAQRAGYRSFEEFEAADPERAAVARDKAGSAAGRTFMWNSAALLAPNFLQSKWLHGSAKNVAEEVRDQVRRTGTSAAAQKSWQDYLGDFSKGVASEGLWEENIQSSVAKYEERLAKGHTDDDAIVGPLKNLANNAWSFAKTVGTLGIMGPRAGSDEDEAGAAIFLGALLGGGSSLIGNYMEGTRLQSLRDDEMKQWNEFNKRHAAAKTLTVDDLTALYKQFGTTKVGEGDNAAEVMQLLNNQGETELDEEALYNFVNHHKLQSTLFGEAQAANAKADQDWTNFNNKMALAGYAWRLMSLAGNRQNANDLLELDPNFSEDSVTQQFGAQNMLSENKDFISSMMDVFEEVSYSAQKEEGMSSDRSAVQFANMMRRTAFFLEAKKRALQTSPTQNESTAEALQEVDAQLQDLKDNRAKYKEMYLTEIDPIYALAKKKSELEKTRADLEKEGKDIQPVLEELAYIDYIEQELASNYGTRAQNYDLGVTMQETSSEAFKEPYSAAAVQSPRSKLSTLAYAVGKNKLVEDRLARNVEAVLEEAIPSDANIDEVVKDINELRTESENSSNLFDQLTADLTTKAESIDTQQKEFDAMFSDDDIVKMSFEFGGYNADQKDTLDALTGGMGDELNEMAAAGNIEEAAAIVRQAYEEVSAANREAFQNLTSQKNKIVDALKELGNRDIQDKDLIQQAIDAYEAGDFKQAHKLLIDSFFADQTNDVRKFYESFLQNREGFLKEAEAQMFRQRLSVMRAAFTLRDDISDVEKSRKLRTIEVLFENLNEVLQQIQENKNDRFAMQSNKALYQLQQLVHSLSLDSNFKMDPLSSIYQQLENLLGAEKLQEVLEATIMEDGLPSPKALKTIINYLANNIKEKDRRALLKEQDERLKSLLDEYKAIRPSFEWIVKIHKLIKNPQKYSAYMISRIANLVEEFENPNTIFYRFSQHRDLSTFIFDLGKIRTQEGTYQGLTEKQTEDLDKAIDVVRRMEGVVSLYHTLNSQVDVESVFNFESELSNKLAQSDTPIAMTEQQSQAVHQLLDFLTSKLRSLEKYSDIAVLQGVLGSGKSLVGTKFAVSIYKKLKGIKDENIAAFGHNENSSKNIAKSVYEDPSNAMTIGDFLEGDMSKVQLVVIDEAMAISNEELDAVYNKVQELNKGRKEKIKILALGDPSQITVEPVEETLLGSLSAWGTKNTSALSVVYRTNVNSIVDVVNQFRFNPNPVTSLSPTVSHSVADMLAMQDLKEVRGVQGGSLQQLIELVKKPSTKSRVVIVNNPTKVAEVRAQLQGTNVEVMTYFDAQSLQWDQAYIYMDPAFGKFDDTAFSTLEFNAAMYTMVGRAREFAFIANPQITINNPIVDPEIAAQRDDNLEEFQKNNALYRSQLNATKEVISLLNPEANLNDDTSTSTPPTTQVVDPTTTTSEQPTVEDILTRPDLLEDSEVSTEEVETSSPTEESLNEDENKEPVSDEQQVPITPAPPKAPKSGVVTFTHSFAYPTSSLDYPNKNRDFPQIVPEQPTFIIKDDMGNYHLVQEYARVAGNYVHLATLGAKDLEDQGMAYVLEKGEQIEGMDNVMIDKSATGFEWKEEYEESKIATVKLEQVHGLRYQYGMEDHGADTPILDRLARLFYEGFYNNAAGGRGLIPEVELYDENGELNWSKLSKFMRVKVFTGSAKDRREIRTANQDFTPKFGIPYLVIHNPSVQGGETNRRQYIRMEPSKLSSASAEIQTLIGYLGLAELLDQNGLRIGTPKFGDLVQAYRKRMKVDENGNLDVDTNVDALALLAEVGYSVEDNQVTDVVDTLDTMMKEYLFGVKYGPVLMTKAEAQEMIKNEDSDYFEGFIEATKNLATKEKTANARVWKVVTQDRTTTMKGFTVSTATSPAQKALNKLALANPTAGDIQIRFNTANRRGRVAKSLVVGKASVDHYYGKVQKELFNVIDKVLQTDAGAQLSEDILSQRNEDGKVSTGKMEDTLEALFQSTAEQNDRATDPEADAFLQIWDDYKETKVALEKEFKANPITLDILKGIVAAAPEMRQQLPVQGTFDPSKHPHMNPVNRFGINKLGSDLSSKENRDAINEALRSNFERVLPTTITGQVTLTGVSTPSSPQQQAPKLQAPNKPKTKNILDHVDVINESILQRVDNIIETSEDENHVALANLVKKHLPDNLPMYQIRKTYTTNQKFDAAYIKSTGQNEFGELRNEGTGAFVVLKQSPLSDTLLLHELLHAITVEALANPTTEKALQFRQEMEELKRVFDEYVDSNTSLSLEEVYQSTPSDLNVLEFVASLSKPEFVDMAKQVKVGTKNLITSIAEAILKFLGLSKEEQTDVYTAMLASIKKHYNEVPQRQASAEQEIDKARLESIQQFKEAIRNHPSFEPSMEDMINEMDDVEELQETLESLDDISDSDLTSFMGAFEDDRSFIDVVANYDMSNKEDRVDFLNSFIGYAELQDRAAANQDPNPMERVKPNGRWLDMFKRIVDAQIVTPEVNLVNRIVYMSRQISNLKSIEGQTKLKSVQSEYIIKSLLQMVWNNAIPNVNTSDPLNPSREGIRATLAAKDKTFVTASNTEIVEELTRQYFDPQNRTKKLKPFFRTVDALTFALSRPGVKGAVNTAVNFMYSDLGGRVDTSAIHKNNKSVKFVFNNFKDPQTYKIAKAWTLDTLNNILEANESRSSSSVVLSRNEILQKLMETLNRDLNNAEAAYTKAKNTLEEIPPQLAARYAYLKALARTHANKPVIFYLLKDIYPNWKVSDLTSLDEELAISQEFANFKDKVEGISKETQDTDQVDATSSLTDSVKEFLSFIKNPTFGNKKGWHPKKYLSTKHAFVTMMNFLHDYVDTNYLDRLNWEQQKKLVLDKIPLSEMQEAMYRKFDGLVRAADSQLRGRATRKITPFVGVYSLEDSLDKSTIAVAYDLQGRLQDKSYEEVRRMALTPNSDVKLITRNFTPVAAYAQLQDMLRIAGETLIVNESSFNELYRMSQARNTLAEMHNTFSSLTDKNYKIGIHENDFGTIKTSYINASGFGSEKSIYGMIRLGLEAYHNEFGIKSLVDDTKMKRVVEKVKDNDVTAIKDFLDYFNLGDVAEYVNLKVAKNSDVLFKLKKFLEGTQGVKDSNSLDEFLSKERGIFRSLGKVLKYSEDALRQKTVMDSNKNKIYTSTPKSWFYVVGDWFKKAGNKIVKGATGWNNFMARKVPEFLETPTFKLSPFVTGLQKIYSISEHDAQKNTLTFKQTSFNRESSQFFYTRAFTHGFVDSLSNSSYGSYDQYLYQVADKPRMPMAEIKVLDIEGIHQSLQQIVKQIRLRPEEFVKFVQKKHKTGRNLNLDVLNEALQNNKDLDLHTSKVEDIADAMFKVLTDKAKNFSETLIDNKVILSTNVGAAIDRLLATSDRDFSHLKDVKSNLSLYNINPNKWTEEQMASMKVTLQPFAELFYLNNYVNSYFLNQLFTGPYEYYKNSEDIVKRMSGVVGPGIYPFVSPTMGSKQKFSALVINDRGKDVDTLERLVDKLIPGNTPADVEAKDELRMFFESFDSTDGQGFMLPQRHEDLAKGYGRAWNLGRVMKPMYFAVQTKMVEHSSYDTMEAAQNAAKQLELDTHDYNVFKEEDGKYSLIIPTPVPVYLKYSSVVLSDDLVTRYPALGKLREFMLDNSADELVFKSAVKAGRPDNSNDLVDLDDIFAEAEIDGAKITSSKLELDNQYYKMQFNPKSKVKSKVSIFTQLMYFINIMGTNETEAQDTYAAVSYLMERALNNLTDEIDTKGVDKVITDRMDSPGNEFIQHMLQSGISASNPTISNKAFTALATYFENEVQKLRFPGAKLVLQSEEGITKRWAPNLDTTENLEKNGLKFVRTENGGFAAEVIVPNGMLSEAQRKAIQKGESIFLMPDFFGYRIPSTEIHSAVPMKVVGTYDSVDTNVIIAPAELVYLHGSDFDVDSLFVISREALSGVEADILGYEDGAPIGYRIDPTNNKLVFKREHLEQDLLSLSDMIDAYQNNLVDREGSLSPERRQLIEKEVNRLKNLQEKIKDGFARNMIMETMLKTITKPENRTRMLTPIVMSMFNSEQNENSLRNYLSDLDLWPTDEQNDLSQIENSFKSLDAMKSGALLTGIFANNIKSLAYLYRAGTDKKPATIVEDMQFEFMVGDTKRKFSKIRDTDVETGNLMWQYQDGAVNLAIDNLKELTLSKIGVNQITGNAFSALLGLGMPLKDTVLLLKNPALQALTRFDAQSAPIEIKKMMISAINEIIDNPIDLSTFNSIYNFDKKLEAMDKAIETALSSLSISLDDLGALSRKDLVALAQNDNSALLEVTEEQGFEFRATSAGEKILMKKLAALQLFNKAMKIGDSLRATSDFLNVIRINPGTAEKMRSFFSAYKAIVKPSKEFKQADIKQIITSKKIGSSATVLDYIEDAYKKDEVKDSILNIEHPEDYAFVAPNLLAAYPHIMSAVKTAFVTKDFADTVIYKNRATVEAYANSVISVLPFQNFGLNRIETEDIINELEHFLIASLYGEQLTEVKEMRTDKRRTTLTNVAAFNHRMLDKIKAVLKADNDAYKANPESHTPNKFLRSLVIESSRYNVRIRIANTISPDVGDIAEMRQAFKDLGNFKLTENSNGSWSAEYDPSIFDNREHDLRNDLLTYNVINSGFKFSNTSYSVFIDEARYLEVDKRFNKLFKNFSEDSDLRDSLRNQFTMAVALKMADRLGNLPKPTKSGEAGIKLVIPTENESIGAPSKFAGYDKGIYYDRKYTYDGKPNNYPEYAVLRIKPQEGEMFREKIDVYQRITSSEELEQSPEHVYYQKIGRKTFEGYHIDPKMFDARNFDPSIRTINVADSNVDNFTSPHKLNVGDRVRIVNYDDIMRLKARVVTIESIKDHPTIKTLNMYTIKESENESSISAGVELKTDSMYGIDEFLRGVTNTTNDLNCK